VEIDERTIKGKIESLGVDALLAEASYLTLKVLCHELVPRTLMPFWPRLHTSYSRYVYEP